MYDEPAILGQGSYGCVIKPPIPCDGKDDKSSINVVGKVYNKKKYFDNEQRLMKLVRDIDPKQKGLIHSTQSCKVNLESILEHPVAYKCDNVRRSQSQVFYQITMPYGGQRIDKFLQENRKKSLLHSHELRTMIMPLFDALCKLQMKGYVHQDIKNGNILVTPHGKAMVIDYGLMVRQNNVYKASNITRLRHIYYTYPPEYKVFARMMNDHGDVVMDIDGIVNDVVSNIDRGKKEQTKRFWTLHSKSRVEKAVRDFTIWVASLDQKQKHKDMKEFAKKVDVFSLGTVILDVIPFVYGNGLKKKLTELVEQMTTVDPRERYSIIEARQRFKEIMRM